MSADTRVEPDNLIAAAIEAAEEIRDPLEALVERTATDPGAPFALDVRERLAALKKEDRAAFETLRAQLKTTGCRVTALDEAIAEENGVQATSFTQNFPKKVWESTDFGMTLKEAGLAPSAALIVK